MFFAATPHTCDSSNGQEKEWQVVDVFGFHIFE
jgi:hypothetical protein